MIDLFTVRNWMLKHFSSGDETWDFFVKRNNLKLQRKIHLCHLIKNNAFSTSLWHISVNLLHVTFRKRNTWKWFYKPNVSWEFLRTRVCDARDLDSSFIFNISELASLLVGLAQKCWFGIFLMSKINKSVWIKIRVDYKYDTWFQWAKDKPKKTQETK